MVKINKIYTRTGDKGDTGLVGGKRVPKDSLRVEAYGEVDELNSFLGLARTYAEQEKRTPLPEILAQLQNELFDLGAELASPGDLTSPKKISVGADQITRLESHIDELMKGIPELRSFVLPGGTPLNAVLHIGRTVCRRAERRVLALSRQEQVAEHAIIYLNRLSDLLFAMARFESHRSQCPEYLWVPQKS